MALSPEELVQVREVVRNELIQRRPGWGTATKILAVFLAVFLGILALHVVVIGGFTIYHLMHPSP